jgi:hypothetical protein
MKQSTTKILLMLVMLSSAMAVQAQVFFQERFNNPGLPAGWTTADPSPNNVLWTRCADQTTNCVGTALNDYGLDAFDGPDAANGFALCNSDGAAGLPSNHVSQLKTSVINCAGKSTVYVGFDTWIGVFDDNVNNDGADETAILQVSVDNVTWTDFQVFEGITGNTSLERFSDNPYLANIDISSVAANQATVYLRWQWTGNFEYWWIIDDVRLSTISFIPHDLELTEFFYPVSSYATPEAHIADDVFSFSATLSHKGGQLETNVKVFVDVVRVENGQIAEILFSDSIAAPVLAPGVTDSVFEFANTFTPALGQGEYAVIYSIDSDSTDLRPGNNADFGLFEVTDFVFAKESGDPNNSIRPSDDGDYTVANLYTLGTYDFNQDWWRAVSAEFAFSSPDNLPASDVNISLNLWKVNDDIEPNFSNFNFDDLTSLTLLGTVEYEAPADAEEFTLYQADLLDLGTLEPVILRPNGRYFLTASYNGSSSPAFQCVRNDVDPSFISTLFYREGTGFFTFIGPANNAVLRLYLDLVVKTDDNPLPESTLAVSPNPASDFVNLQVKFEEPTNMAITIADMNGRIIRYDERPAMLNDVVTYPTNNLADGTYLARLTTAKGTRTIKFVVQH